MCLAQSRCRLGVLNVYSLVLRPAFEAEAIVTFYTTDPAHAIGSVSSVYSTMAEKMVWSFITSRFLSYLSSEANNGLGCHSTVRLDQARQPQGTERA